MARLKNVWSSSNISLHLKIKLFNACVKSVLLYGCETWFVTNNITQKLQAFVNRSLRNILGIWWLQIISNQELWKRTGQSKITVEIRRREINMKICPSTLEWNPQGKRSCGSPKSHLEANCFGRLWKKAFCYLRAQAKNNHQWNLKIDGLHSELFFNGFAVPPPHIPTSKKKFQSNYPLINKIPQSQWIH